MDGKFDLVHNPICSLHNSSCVSMPCVFSPSQSKRIGALGFVCKSRLLVPQAEWKNLEEKNSSHTLPGS